MPKPETNSTAIAGSSPVPCSGFFVMAADFRCTLEMCPPGLFCHGDTFGFKTEYSDQNGPEAYCVESGEYFWGGTDDKEVRRALKVTPCIIQNVKVHTPLPATASDETGVKP